MLQACVYYIKESDKLEAVKEIDEKCMIETEIAAKTGIYVGMQIHYIPTHIPVLINALPLYILLKGSL